MLLIAGLLALCTVSAAGQDIIEDLSFAAPLSEFDVDGTRLVPGYRKGGHAEAMKTFVRLTPDRADKAGSLWSRAALNKEVWTAELKFRISGAGRTLFGDGLALWYTTDTQFRPGRLHGHNEFFTGFGVVLDTFVNTENAARHKDVSLIFGDSKNSPLAPPSDAPPVPGCDGDFRYSEARDDFAPAERFAAVRLVKERNSVSVFLDARGTGDFKSCISSLMLPQHLRGNEWWSMAHIGVSASTGQLADNHDVLALQVWNGLVQSDVFEEQSPLDIAQDWATGDEKVDNAIRAAVSAMEARLEDRLHALEHHVEHQMVGVQEGLTHTIKELSKKEAAAEGRLEKLATQVKHSVARDVGSAFDESVAARLRVVEEKLTEQYAGALDRDIMPTLNRRMDEMGSGSSWLTTAVLVLLFLVAGVAFYTYRTSQQLRKSHLP